MKKKPGDTLGLPSTSVRGGSIPSGRRQKNWAKGPSLLAAQIEERSFEIISKLLPEQDQSRPEWHLIRRIVHATGDPTIAQHIRIHPQAIEAGIQALLAGRPIIADVTMVAVGISQSLARLLGSEVVCAVKEPAVLDLAREKHLTRSAAAMFYLSPRLPGAVVAIGNAPTALATLLDYLGTGLPAPALVVGTPVGFVGAAEAKARLLKSGHPSLPYVTVEGTRGGSAVAAATVNALLQLALKKKEELRH